VAFKENIKENVSTELNFIGKGTIITGDIQTSSNLRVDGKVKGKVVCKNTLTIGEGGIIEGDIQANNAIIGGKINGKIVVNEKLELEARSSLIGELKAKKLIIDEGAVFDGTSTMSAEARPAATPAIKP
jgi:cytoskeletal protein CcmA (bactofilin family)